MPDKKAETTRSVRKIVREQIRDLKGPRVRLPSGNKKGQSGAVGCETLSYWSGEKNRKLIIKSLWPCERQRS